MLIVLPERAPSTSTQETSKMFTIVTRPNCTYCVKEKYFLESRGKDFKMVDLVPEMAPLFDAFGFKTVPQIWDGTAYVGGYDQLREYVK